MSAQEFILIPKENYIKNQPKASEILDDPTITAKSQQLTLSQSIPELLDVASKKKTPKQAVRAAVRKTVKKQLGGSKRRRRGKRFIRRKKFTRRSRSDFFSRVKNVD